MSTVIYPPEEELVEFESRRRSPRSNPTTPIQKPALKWAGNKQKTPVGDRLRELYSPYRKSHAWEEWFVGAGGSLLAVDPGVAYCSDASHEIITLHQWIKVFGGQGAVWFDREWSEEDYYSRRDRFNELQCLLQEGQDFDVQEFCGLMIWLNRAGFNGLWRVNSKGIFNAPVGKDSKGRLPRFDFPAVPTYRQAWQFSVISKEVTGDRVTYADPPYHDTFSSYTSSGFSWANQVELADRLEALSNPVIASNSNHPDVVELYRDRGFAIEFVEVKRSINRNGKQRKGAIELLAHKNLEVPGGGAR